MNWREATHKSWKAFRNNMPILLGIVLLIGLLNNAVPKSLYSSIFMGIPLVDAFIGAFSGSILVGNPITSYIIGGELLDQGIGLIAVTAFIVAWVTVGVVQFPAESMMLGKRFAFVRNIVSFVFSIIVAIITVILVGLI